MNVLNVAYPGAPVSFDVAGGAEQVVAELDRGLRAAGHESVVVAKRGSSVMGQLFEFPDDPPGAMSAVAEAIARTKPDVVHYHGIDFASYFAPAAVSGVTLHLPVGWYSAPDLLRQQHLVFVSQSQRRTAAGLRGDVIPNGVDLERFRPGERVEDFALCLGRICPEKGYHRAIAAAAESGRTLVLAGQVYPFPAHEDYFEQVIRPAFGEKVHFVGPVGQVQKISLLQQAFCLLIPSEVEETSSLVAMEASACGTPVIAFRTGALPEIVNEGVTGFLVDDEQAMSKALQRVESINRRKCREEAVRRFDVRRTVAQYLDWYASIRGLG